MEPIVFCLHFRGQASRGTDKRNLFRVTASAPSCNFATEVSEDGVSGKISVLPGDMAFSESELELTGSDSFSGHASLSFGDGPHTLELKAAAAGHFESAAKAGTSGETITGAITWHVAGGDGQFSGAKGFVTSVLTLREDGQFSEYQTGVLFLSES
jgi:hypothetical protein